MARLFQNFLGGELSADITDADGTITSPAFAAMIAVSGGDTLTVVLDPDGIVGEPEIITVTAHAAGTDTVTATRGAEGTTARAHDAGMEWVAPLTAEALSNLPTSGDSGFAVNVYDEGLAAYPARPDATVVRYIGPVEPTDWTDIDEWRVYGDPPPLDPDAVPTLAQWFKADALGLADGAAVTTWTASTGTDATQATAGNQPTFQTAEVNGLPVVRFDGTDDFLEWAGFGVALSEGTFLAVVRPAVLTGNQTLLSQDAANFMDDFQWGVDPESTYTTPQRWGYSFHRSSGSVRNVVIDPTVPDIAAFQIIGVRFNATTHEIFRDSASAAVTEAQANYLIAHRTWNIGRNPQAAARYFDGDVAEIALYSTALADVDLASIVAGFKAKYGLT